MSNILAQFGMHQASSALRSPIANMEEALIPGSSTHMVSASGEFNAYDKRDICTRLSEMAALSSKNVVASKGQHVPSESELRQARREASEMVTAAFHSPDDRAFEAVGSTVANWLSETANRQGFMRRLFKRAEVEQGGFPRIPVLYKNVHGYVASSSSSLEAQQVRNKYLTPPEFYIEAYPMIEEREIQQAPGDLLEAKMAEGQEATMTQEDRMAMRLINQVSGIDNEILTIRGSLTPANLGVAMNQIRNWDLPVDTLLIASDLWTDLTTSAAFGSWYDPVSMYEIVQTGTIGTLLGMKMISDAYRVPTQKVLNRGDLYCLTAPEYLGGYTDRGPLQCNAINASALGMGYPGRGWHMWELISMGVVGGRGVSRCRRVA